MTDTSDLGPVPEAFDPAKSYRVRLAEPITMPGFTLNRGGSHVIGGDIAEANRDKIVAAREEAL